MFMDWLLYLNPFCDKPVAIGLLNFWCIDIRIHLVHIHSQSETI